MSTPRGTARPLQPHWPFVFLLLLLSTPRVLASPVQYCAVDEKHNVDQCIVASSYRNASTGGNDLQLYLSAKFEGRKGYAAFGTGPLMDGSLMFVLYPGRDAGEVTFSLRTTRFHNPPEVAHDAPAYSVISTTVDGSYHNVGIVCHSCDSWPGNSLSVTSEKQAWVFANNYDWLMQTDDPTKPLTLHTFYDQFHLNMKLIHSDVESLGPWELIDNARTSVLGPGETSSSTSSRRPSPYVIHGALLSLAFMALMPAAVTVIRIRHESSFRSHWILQTISVAAATSGIGLGAYSSQLLIEVPSARGSHQITGLLILASLLAAPSLGYLHHVRFLKLGHRTAFTEWHRRTGYTTIASGWANVLLGLYVAGRSTWWSAAVTSWCVILVCCISMIPKYVNSGRLRQSYVKLEQVSE